MYVTEKLSIESEIERKLLYTSGELETKKLQEFIYKITLIKTKAKKNYLKHKNKREKQIRV